MSVDRIVRVEAASARGAPDAHAWLAAAGGPFRVDVEGAEAARTRVITTLIHGNEPSGVRALHRWLQTDPRPAVSIVAFVVSVPAALGPPPFAHRTRPGGRDLNRCFDRPISGPESRLAAELVRQIHGLAPELLVDLHNTSAPGPAYSVVTGDDPERRALTALFAPRMIVTDLRLGALTEALEGDVTAVVVECGGASDAEADAVALRGLRRFVDAAPSDPRTVEVLRHPLRVELDELAELRFADGPERDADVTIDRAIGEHNFGPAAPGTVLGWLGARGLGSLRVRRGDGSEAGDELLESVDGELRLRCAAQLLMATDDPAIARADCLFYAVPLGQAPSPDSSPGVRREAGKGASDRRSRRVAHRRRI